MAQFFSVHPQNPQPRLIRQAVNMVRDGGIIAYPTDSCYALGCHLDDKQAVERIRAIRGLDARHLLTLLCCNLSDVSRYARVTNSQYRLLKAATPGCYTFILEASREVPRRVQHPKRNTIGLRIPDHPVVQSLLVELGEPLLSASLILPAAERPLTNPLEIREQLEHSLDLILDAGVGGLEMTTVIAFEGDTPEIVRLGKGDPARLGL